VFEIDFGNAYPGYFEDYEFEVRNYGASTVRLREVIINGIQDYEQRLDLNNDGLDDIEIAYFDGIGAPIGPGESSASSPKMHFLQSPSAYTLSFSIQLVYEADDESGLTQTLNIVIVLNTGMLRCQFDEREPPYAIEFPEEEDATTTCWIDAIDPRYLHVAIENAFPSYEVHITYVEVNNGTIPCLVQIPKVNNVELIILEWVSVDFDNDGHFDASFRWTDRSAPEQLDPGHSEKCELDIRIEEGFTQSLSFCATMEVDPWNMPSSSYWANFLYMDGSVTSSTDHLPDLEMSISSIVPSNPVEGQPTTITALVSNIGEGEAHDILVDFRQSARYIDPVNDPDQTMQIWPFAEIDSLNPQESRSITVVWNATEILNAYNTPIELIVDPDNTILESCETNNAAVPIHDTSNVVIDVFGFDAQTDGYSFKNWGFTNNELKDIRRELSIFFRSFVSTAISPILQAIAYPFVTKGGHCFGMAATSILYYKGIMSKPVAKDTFMMLKDEVSPDIAAYFMQQNSLSFFIPFWLKQTFTPFNLGDVYNKIETNLEYDNPLLMLLWKDGTNDKHAVTVINAYSVSDDIKNVVIYDNEYPGMGTVVTFNLKENRIIWNKLFDPPRYYYDRADVAPPEPYTSDVIAKIIGDFISSLLGKNRRILTFQCPIDVDITDEFGRVASSRNGGITEIPDAEVTIDNITGSKIFFLPLNLNYHVNISAYSTGEIEMGQMLPDYGGGTFSDLVFNATESTSASCDLTRNEPGFLLQIDEDGDGIVDYEAVPESTYVPAQWKTSFISPSSYPIVDFAIYNQTLFAVSGSKLFTYNGNSWNTVCAPTYVTSIESYQDKLIVGGQGGLYSYNGTTFRLIFTVTSCIKVLGAYDNKLYTGTLLDNPPTMFYCDGPPEDLSSWHEDIGFSAILIFSKPFGSIESFAEYNGNLYVSSGGTVYSYNGTEWSVIKTFDDAYSCLDMQICNGKLYLSTRDQAWRNPVYEGGTGFSGRVIEFDGKNWTTILEHNYWIFALETYNGKLYAGTANEVLTYDGTSWDTSLRVSEGAYYAICFITYDGKIYVGMGNGYTFDLA
jgi:hypothetical protein